MLSQYLGWGVRLKCSRYFSPSLMCHFPRNSRGKKSQKYCVRVRIQALLYRCVRQCHRRNHLFSLRVTHQFLAALVTHVPEPTYFLTVRRTNGSENAVLDFFYQPEQEISIERCVKVVFFLSDPMLRPADMCFQASDRFRMDITGG